MIQEAKTAQNETVLRVAQAMCTAARTAPKARGRDHLHALVATGEDIEKIALEMERLSKKFGFDFFERDAGNLRNSGAVVLLGYEYHSSGLDKGCQMCGYDGCEACAAAGAVCVFSPMDLGIAVGSAVSVAADSRVDNRVMFSVGRTVLEMGLFPAEVKVAVGIPLSVSGKSPYHDRKPQGNR